MVNINDIPEPERSQILAAVAKEQRYPRVIGLYSPAMGSGKSTVANYLIKEHGYKLIKFAEPLKAMTNALIPFLKSDEVTEYGKVLDLDQYVEGGYKEKVIEPFGVSPRKIMQTLGTEWGRKAIYENFWVDITKQRIKDLTNWGSKVVVDDMRYPNEFDAIQALNGMTIRIERPGVKYEGTHTSEGALENFPFNWMLSNHGTVEALLYAVHAIVQGVDLESPVTQ